MSTKSITQAVSNVVEQLTDFSSEERRRIVHASLTLLGDAATTLDEKMMPAKVVTIFPRKLLRG